MIRSSKLSKYRNVERVIKLCQNPEKDKLRFLEAKMRFIYGGKLTLSSVEGSRNSFFNQQRQLIAYMNYCGCFFLKPVKDIDVQSFILRG